MVGSGKLLSGVSICASTELKNCLFGVLFGMADYDFKAQAALLDRMAVRRNNPVERQQLLSSAETLRALGRFRDMALTEDADVDHLSGLLAAVVGLPSA